AVIPSYSAPVTKLPELRRQAFCDRVTSVITTAMIGRSGPPAVDEGTAAALEATPASVAPGVLAKACAQCQGFCCRRGGNHAYLTGDTIRRYSDAHPSLSSADILAAYMSRVGQVTFEGSCIYHGSHGCTLPADM